MTQDDLKRRNIERLLSALQKAQPISRKGLSDQTEMSPASVTRIIGALTALGLVREVSLSGDQTRGRKAVNLRTVADGMFTVGCTVEKDDMRFVLMDFDRQCRGELAVPFVRSGYAMEDVAECLRQGVKALTAGRPCAAVGISVSGCVDDEAGHVLSSQAFRWRDLPLAQVMGGAIGLPVHVENDVKACLVWESIFRGLDDGARDTAYLYLGHAGVGFANQVRGQLVRGMNNAAGEIEGLMLGTGDALDQHLMTASLLKRAKRMSPTVDSIDELLEAYRLELPWARLLVEDLRLHINMVMGLVRGLLSPHLLILGGDLPERLMACPGILPEGDYVIGQHFERSCALGAAAIAMQNALEALLDGLPHKTMTEGLPC